MVCICASDLLRCRNMHRQNDYLHSLRMQPALDRKRDLVVQQPRDPGFVVELELGCEENNMRKFHARPATLLHCFIHSIYAEAEVILGSHPILAGELDGKTHIL